MPKNEARSALATRSPGQFSEHQESYPSAKKYQHLESIRTAIQALRVIDGQVFELRALEVPTRYRPVTVAGWFDDYEAMAQAAVELGLRRAPAVYVTLNPVSPQLLGRACNHTVEGPRATTADHDVVRRVWLPFDIDPVRPAYVSATPHQIEDARLRAIAVTEWMHTEFELKPDLRGFSGNGYHLLYRLDEPNNAESTEYIKGLIETVADRFDDEEVKVDRTVFNASRIWKLYGTTVRKGEQLERLGMFHRRAELLSQEVMEKCSILTN